MGKRRERPCEGEGEVVFVGRLLVVSQPEDGILKGEEDSWIHIEGEVQIDRPSAALLGMKIDLPNLAQRVGLHEMAFVVDVEAVVYGVILEVGYVPGNVYGCHIWGAYREPEGPYSRR